MKPVLYLAAPLFSHSEKAFNVELAGILSVKFDVFLPQRDNHLIVDLIAGGMSVDAARRKVFDGDLAAIQSCDVLFAVLDGRSVDEGTCFELGYAHASGKTCVGLQTDPRRLLPIGNNPMLQCTLTQVLQSLDEVVAWARS
ncbi:nucleoside 2-deoxyribosyltransferase [Rhizobium rhizogenes]|uniref:Nucleoside 2-deoxyribosyltransferase n=1 Tax=Rhizobium rhizogenes NBRC 13257 TaxID=1220581 RepID=A0AA87U709_RHIRH|nr:nucleoside 2-deoxyribosyltransferase [Rhizobium rhizogenes]NTG63001.1 nucleoside 2-deoxyribosyltransferase [Rhizobium rhizogenes]NTG69509.1 nucleoside 2-deoxyribosyltransferase [Rhizobium rhizogenes]NTG82462.1 nucleoside 2-deoxyribosyltransferase [Rhizobium rhizogenes]NTH27777.1 nucleoside 2-deoxyribosyltransferase [Rhizobium rhizogenes]NTH98204.1 nucleoside 2-deoxyribosyltransferase [Rhizobium rhizogenes]